MSIPIGAPIDDDNLVSVTLNNLGREYAQFWTSIRVPETFSNFPKLIALLLSKEQRKGDLATRNSQESAFYPNQDKGRGRGRGHFGDCSQNQN